MNSCRNRRALALLLAFAMVLGMAPGTVFAAETGGGSELSPSADVLGRSVSETKVDQNVISVGTAWGKEIKFTYHETRVPTEWDPETLTYKSSKAIGSSWAADTDNRIEVTSRSGVAVKVRFRWIPDEGYSHIRVGTSENGFVLDSAYGLSEDTLPRRTVIADVIKGSLEAGQEDYRLMGVLAIELSAAGPEAALVYESGLAIIDDNWDEPNYPERPVSNDGRLVALQDERLTLSVTGDGAKAEGATYTWHTEGKTSSGSTRGDVLQRVGWLLGYHDYDEVETPPVPLDEPCGSSVATVVINRFVDLVTGDKLTVSCKIDYADGTSETVSEEFYAIENHGLTHDELYMVGYTGEPNEDLVVPNVVQDKNGDFWNLYECTGSTFSDCANLRSLTFGDNIRYFQGSTFKNCANLESVRFDYDGVLLGTCTFQNCRKLVSVNTENIADIWGSFTFVNCSSLERLDLSSAGLEDPSGGMIMGCSSLKELIFPDVTTTMYFIGFQKGAVDANAEANVDNFGEVGYLDENMRIYYRGTWYEGLSAFKTGFLSYSGNQWRGA